MALAALSGLVLVAPLTGADAKAARASRPTHLHVSSSSAGTYLTWHAGSATGFVVEQATNHAMTHHLHIYRLRGQGHQFTPYGLTRGKTYYFRVRTHRGSSRSAYTGAVHARVRSSEQDVHVMTYNILEASVHHESGHTIAPWSKRRAAAARLIESSDPDVIAVQEGADYVTKSHRVREVDSLRSALGGRYTLAHTEIAPGHKHYFRTGCYILYKTSAYRAIGKGGHWNIGTSGEQRFAAYQGLANRRTGARFLAVSPHLLVGAGATDDRLREDETKRLFAAAHAHGAHHHLPVVYAGDYNSRSGKHVAFDGAGIAMRAHHVADAFAVAQTRTAKKYDSANQYLRTPPAYEEDIDHIYAPPGVAVRSWKLVLKLHHGRFVGTIPSDHNPLVSDMVIPY